MARWTSRRALTILTAGAVLSVSTQTNAQTADGLLASDKATEGSTDVAAEGFQTTDIGEASEKKDTTEFKVSAGGLLATGNSRLLAVTGAARFRTRRDDNQLSMAAAANYSRSAPTPDDPVEVTIENFQGKTRYDRFLGKGFAVFLSMSGRNDRFQGLDLRLNLDPGVAYYFIDRDKLLLWTELGYDYQYDFRRGQTIREAEATEGIRLAKTDERHSTRAFFGYENNVNEAITVSTGLEYLQGFPDTSYWRLNWDLGLNSALSNAFSIATTFSLRYDRQPLPSIKRTDTVTAVSLVYQLL
jgi:putative salt-induced outer membrane protein